jgi:hypothetical protein
LLVSIPKPSPRGPKAAIWTMKMLTKAYRDPQKYVQQETQQPKKKVKGKNQTNLSFPFFHDFLVITLCTVFFKPVSTNYKST